MTSTLQQEAGRKLRFSSRADMRWPSACTRTATSPTCAPTAPRCRTPPLDRGPGADPEQYGRDYLPDAPAPYASKVKNAQEAHEAIRPAGDTFRTPGPGRGASCSARRAAPLRADLAAHRRLADDRRPGPDAFRCGSGATTTDGRDAEFAASRQDHQFPGFLRAYVEGSDDPEADARRQERAPAGDGRGRRARPRRASRPRATRPSRRPASPRPRSSSGWRSSASAARRPTPRSCRPSRTAATCGRRARPSCPPSPRSP